MAEDPVKILEALKESRSATRHWRMAIGLSSVGVILVYGFCFYSLVADFDDAQFAERFAQRASTVAPALLAQTGEAADRLIPVYSDEAAKQADQGLVKLHLALMKEYQLLLKDVDVMTSSRSSKLSNQIHGGIDAALSSNYPVFAKDAALRRLAVDAVLSAFEGAAQDALDARAQRPSNELKRLIMATANLAEQATENRNKKARAPELRMVIAMLGLVSRELANERARLVVETEK
jgi:hypothetical protein